MGLLNAFSAMGRILVMATVACVSGAIVFHGDTRVALFVVALSLGVTGLVFIGVGSRLGRVSTLDRMLRARGVSGLGTVTSLGETGVRINGVPVIEFGLFVDSAVHAPYSATIRQRLPHLSAGLFLPGTVVAVRVDPTDREHLAIDWDTDPPIPEATPAAPSGLTTKGIRDAEDLLSAGRRGTAVITSMEGVGDMFELGLAEIATSGDDDRLFTIALEVKQAGMAPYEVRVAHRVPERLLGRVGPRTRVAVAIDRDDDHAVAIDWSSVRR